MEGGAKRRDFEAARTADPKPQIPNSKETTKSNCKMENGAKPRDLEDRTFRFAESLRAFVKPLPRTASNAEGCSTTRLRVGFGRCKLD